jgi:RNA polymerase sigma-70 factor (ECF subfamily)
VAEVLETTEESVTSALKRARATLARHLPGDRSAPPPHSAVEQRLVTQLVDAFESADVDGIMALLTEDAWVRMPPVPLEYQGRELAGQFFATVAFREGRRYRLVPTRANGQPAFGVYLVDRTSGLARAFGLLVITMSGDEVSAITRFDNAVISRFGLPRTLPGAGRRPGVDD